MLEHQKKLGRAGREREAEEEGKKGKGSEGGSGGGEGVRWREVTAPGWRGDHSIFSPQESRGWCCPHRGLLAADVGVPLQEGHQWRRRLSGRFGLEKKTDGPRNQGQWNFPDIRKSQLLIQNMIMLMCWLRGWQAEGKVSCHSLTGVSSTKMSTIRFTVSWQKKRKIKLCFHDSVLQNETKTKYNYDCQTFPLNTSETSWGTWSFQ